MTDRCEGTLRDTYAAAIHHDLVSVANADRVVGVVRRPTAWFPSLVDENYTALGPPAELLDDFDQRQQDLKMQGLCDEGAHNAAWDDVDFAARYRAHLRESETVRERIQTLTSAIQNGDKIVLICFENTAKKRCHRTLLREEIEDRLDASD